DCPAMHDDPAAVAGVEAIKRWIASSLLDDDTNRLCEQVRDARGDDPLGGPDGTSTVLGVLHAQAKNVLAASPGKFTYRGVRSRLANADALLSRIEPGLVGGILVEA